MTSQFLPKSIFVERYLVEISEDIGEMNDQPGNEMASRENLRKFKELLRKSDNRICADCGAPDPKWASSNIGVFICVKCSGVHRSLGAHISKVLSVSLDEWSDEDMESMIAVGGNSYANAIYEAFLPSDYSKPTSNSSNDDRLKFIRAKYELQEFLKPSLRIVPSKSSSKTCTSEDNVDYDMSDNMAGMVEYIGILKVKVLKGTNLVVKDVRSSDPYVVLTLGHQKAQTTAIKSTLNPAWNEELKFSVPQAYGLLKLEVYDHDILSGDDIMGEAEIDLEPMIASAMAFGDPDLLPDMQIGKWLKSTENALIDDSYVNIIDGKIKQEVSLKLQKVESGEIYLDMEFIPLIQ